MSMTETLKHYFSSKARASGQTYFAQREVEIDREVADQLEATVYGYNDEYHLRLSCEPGTLHATCTCRDAQDNIACRHLWGTLLAAHSTAFARNASIYRCRMLKIGTSSATTVLAPEPALKAEAWFAGMEGLVRAAQQVTTKPPTAQDQLVVVGIIKDLTQKENRLRCQILIRDRRANGEWGTFKAKSNLEYTINNISDPVGQKLARKLILSNKVAAGYSYGYVPSYALNNEDLEYLAPELVEPDRLCLFASSDLKKNPTRLTLDPRPWRLTASVVRTPDEQHWQFTGRLERDGVSVMGKELVLATSTGVIYKDQLSPVTGDAGLIQILPLLLNSDPIHVPVSKTTEFLAQLLKMPQAHAIELPPELCASEETSPPKPILKLRPSQQRQYKNMIHGELLLEYGQKTIAYASTAAAIYNEDERKIFRRDTPLEQTYHDRLLELGFRPDLGYGPDGRVVECIINNSNLSAAVRTLLSENWHVEAEGKVYKQTTSFKVNVSSGVDWFEMDANASFGDIEVPMPRLLEALRKGDGYVLLDDGSHGMLPEEWLKKFGIFAKMGEIHGDQVRFRKSQIGVLDALLEARPEIEFDKTIAKARAKLQKFQGVTAIDPPKNFTGELREYQREGLGWLNFLRDFGFGGCLADDMGLGKTVQVLAMLCNLKKGQTALVVVPKSLIFNWKAEAAKFAPKLKVYDHTGLERAKSTENFKDYNIILTTYGTLRRDIEMLSEYKYNTCILDESQAAKNSETGTAKAVRLIQADHRLAMSGTPIENHLGELGSLFDFLNPGMLGASGSISGAFARNADEEARQILAKAIRPYILRRTKEQVAKDLPEKTEQTLYCDLEPKERKMYDELRDHYRSELLKKVDEVGLNRSQILVLEALLRLRQAACHPGLLDKKLSSETSTKLSLLMEQLEEVMESGTKVLVFSQFTSLLAILKRQLDKKKLTYLYLDGKTSSTSRAELVQQFQTDPKCQLFLMSLKAGGVGLNLTAAEYVFLLDPWWNPAVEAQAIDRSHRIGQTKPVFAYRIIARDTVEEKVLKLQETKRDLAESILSGQSIQLGDLRREDIEMLLS
ncbi:MAG: SNF2-related protein [Fimbriiglobus sp.]